YLRSGGAGARASDSFAEDLVVRLAKPSFRGDAKHRARNLEIPRCAIARLRSGADAPSRNDGALNCRSAPLRNDEKLPTGLPQKIIETEPLREHRERAVPLREHRERAVGFARPLRLRPVPIQ